jgi:PKHD-type hydroxylase
MFKLIPDLLSRDDVARLRQIAASAKFTDGRFSNPHSKVKNNLQLHEPAAYEQAARIILVAMRGHEDFTNFVRPFFTAPPMLTRYTPGMHYGRHTDSAFIQAGTDTIRADVSCTVFLSDPATYEGGALRIDMGGEALRFRGAPGSALVYPSNSLHEVEPVTQGERLVAITFIQSRIRDPFKRHLVYELFEVAALEGYNMSYENMTRLRHVGQELLRSWAE